MMSALTLVALAAGVTPAEKNAALTSLVASAQHMAARCGPALQEALGFLPADLSAVRYSDGSRHAQCGTDVAIAVVGEPYVALCPRFWSQAARDPVEAAVTLVHEGLHVAGLRERPMPGAGMSSVEIQNAVRARCVSTSTPVLHRPLPPHSQCSACHTKILPACARCHWMPDPDKDPDSDPRPLHGRR